MCFILSDLISDIEKERGICMYVLVKLILGSEEYDYVEFCNTENEVPALYQQVNKKLDADLNDEAEVYTEMAKDENDPHKTFADLQSSGIVGKNAKQVTIEKLCKLSWK